MTGYEVHLLVDYVSGRAGLTLTDLGDLPLPGAVAGAAAPEKAQNAIDILKRFSEIVYPPPPDKVREKAENATLLLTMKDRLNGMADPANGLTIAYTSMFAVGSAHTLSIVRWAASLFNAKAAQRQDAREADRTSRVTLAREAYPGLKWSAARFSWIFGIGLPFVIALLFIMTAMTYWDVSLGRLLLHRVEQHDRASLPSGGYISLESCQKPPATGAPPACEALILGEGDLQTARQALSDFRAAITECSWSGGYLPCPLNLLRPTFWGLRAYGLTNLTQGGQLLDHKMASFLALFSSYVLPMMFGLLGTLASTVRVIQAKVRDYVLAPHDLPLTLLGLLLGPLAGFTIGLFFDPSDTTPTSTSGLTGGVILTPSGLGFLAGYGADSFFKMLDALLVRVFSLEQGKS